MYIYDSLCAIRGESAGLESHHRGSAKCWSSARKDTLWRLREHFIPSEGGSAATLAAKSSFKIQLTQEGVE